MMQKSISILILSVLLVLQGQAQIVIDRKGTKITIDSSKWKLTDSNIYNKNRGSVGIGTAGIAHSDAILEVKAANKGLLMPRLALTSTTSASPLSAHVAGMIVYNTATTGDVSPGVYHNNGTIWQKAVTTVGLDGTNDAWINDNANTQLKLGTLSDGTTARSDSTQVVIKNSGRVGIGLTNPAGLLDVKGKMFVNNRQTVYNAAALNASFGGSLFIGDGGQALSYNSGDETKNNTSLGLTALRDITTGNSNTAAGYASLRANTTGNFNAAFGAAALLKNTTGNNNTATGAVALYENLTGSHNAASGYGALRNNTTGTFNVALGSSSLYLNKTGEYNTAMGYISLYNNESGKFNTAAGHASLNKNTVGEFNSAYGTSAIFSNTTGSDNTAIGHTSLYNNTTGNNNAIFGSRAFFNNTEGSSNTVVGYNTGLGIVTGSNNTILGANIINLPADLSKNIILADGAGVQRIRVLPTGSTGIGTASPRARLTINGYAQLAGSDAIADTITTAATRAGMIRYNSSSKALEYHNDTQWVATASAGIADITNDAWINDNAATSTSIKLATLSNGTTARTDATQVVIKDNGNVGIGITSPAEKLHVESNLISNFLGIANFFAPANTNAGNASMLRLGVANSTKDAAELRYVHNATNSNQNRLDLSFDGLSVAPLSIQAGGNVGIGTPTPAKKLHVAGEARADNTISAPNYIATVQTITGTWDLSLGANASWTLAAGANTLTVNNARAGMYGLIRLTNAGTSTITLPANSKVINNGGGAVLLTQTAMAVDILTFYYDGTNYWWTYGNNYN